MPELPDVEVYIHALHARVVGHAFSEFKIFNPFVLRTVTPKPEDMVGIPITGVERLGKRVVFRFEGDQWMVVHLMISGRFRWLAKDGKMAPKMLHARWFFEEGDLLLTEASPKKRAGIWLGVGETELHAHDPGGVDPLTVSLADFRSILARENRTLKRALTNPRWLSGIGNAFSDEILHAARISPLRLTSSLYDEETERLWKAMSATLILWRDRLIQEFGDKFPGAGQITAFRPDFATHGKYGQPCPVCGKPIQRIVYADNETNYCAVCQNEGRILADRALSRLLKDDWPRSFAEQD